MRLLVAYAVEPEFAPWRKLRSFSEVRAGAAVLRRTQIGGAEVDFVVTGMGPERAQRALEAIDLAGYQVCIAAGFAGALVPKLQVGDVLVAKKARRGQSNDLIECDAALAEQAVGASAKAIGELVSVDHVATTAEEKYALTPYGEAVDMESYTVLAAAQRQRVPHVAIRVISDRHDQILPVDLSTTVDENGQVAIGSVMRMLAGKPGQIGALMRLGRESKIAAEKLAKFLEGYIEKMALARMTGGPTPLERVGN